MSDDSEQYRSPLIHQMTKEKLAKLLPLFVIKIQNKNGDPYPPNTLYQLCCGLLWQICITNPSWNIFVGTVQSTQTVIAKQYSSE